MHRDAHRFEQVYFFVAIASICNGLILVVCGNKRYIMYVYSTVAMNVSYRNEQINYRSL